jgi:hypothetical protein
MNHTYHAGLFQLIPMTDWKNLQGHTVTLGAWVWADEPVRVYGPGINSLDEFQDRWFGFDPVLAGTDPVYVTSSFELPAQNDRIQLWLRATTPDNISTRIYYTGISLVTGGEPAAQSLASEVSYISADRRDEQTIRNYARNENSQYAWPYLKPWASRMLGPSISEKLQSSLALVFDQPGAGWYLRWSAAILFRSFWGKFGWGQVSLAVWPGLVLHPYRFPVVLTLLAVTGVIAMFVRKGQSAPWRVSLLLSSVTAMVVVIALVYGLTTMGGALRFRGYLPVARYIFPAVIPLVGFLTAGWHELFRLAGKQVPKGEKWGLGIYVAVTIFMALYALYSNMMAY